jgi:ABC-type glycerol-3-phosphate transport system substrate-binding protein
VCNGLEYIWTHGGNVLDPEDPSKVVIDSPESVAGLATEHSMIADGVSPEAVLHYKEDESHATFLRGDAVFFLRNWPYRSSRRGRRLARSATTGSTTGSARSAEYRPRVRPTPPRS